MMGHMMSIGKIMYRPYSSCISSIQEINKDSIEFFLSSQIRSRIKCSPLSLTFSLSTQTWSKLKLSWLKSYIYTLFVTNFIWTYLHQFFGNFYNLNSAQKPIRGPSN